MTTSRLGMSELIKRGVLAGAAGGLAEIIWVSVYASMTGGDAALLARGVTTAAGVTAFFADTPIATGIALHMVLAVLLGVVLAGLWQVLARRGFATGSLFGVMLAALAGVWVMNFFVILPVLSPAFIALIPYPVSLTSKLLFGLSAAETLRRCAAPKVASVSAAIAVRASGKGKNYPSR